MLLIIVHIPVVCLCCNVGVIASSVSYRKLQK